jgi:hypothetical protein
MLAMARATAVSMYNPIPIQSSGDRMMARTPLIIYSRQPTAVGNKIRIF